VIEHAELPMTVREGLAAEARTAFPRECCGFVEGSRDGNTLHISQIHPATNLSADPDRFEIDPADHICLLKRLRGTGRDIIGCYHSHPNGRAEPSERDREYAFGDGFLWLIVAIKNGNETSQIGAFEVRGDGHTALTLVPAAA
jgi:proteasome lid subunit RPN8/RPN11